MGYKDWGLKEECEMGAKVAGPLNELATVIVGREKGEKAQIELSRLKIRKHQLRLFLPALPRLGIDTKTLSPAQISGRFHYLSNAVGGFSNLEYVEVSEKETWVRYWPAASELLPGLASPGRELATAECWHANNGALLHTIGVRNALRLGVVVTKLRPAGDPVYEVYFKEYDRDLFPDERCQVIPHPNPPDSTYYGDKYIELLQKGAGADNYPVERSWRGKRAFANYYQESIQEAMIALFGTAPACSLLNIAWRVLAVYRSRLWKKELGIEEKGAEGMALFIKAMGDIQGDKTEMEKISRKEYLARWKTCRMFRDRYESFPQLFRTYNAFFETCAECFRMPMVGPKTRVQMVKSMAEGDTCFEWLVKEY